MPLPPVSDKTIAIKQALTQLSRRFAWDGVIVLAFDHTDEGKRMTTHVVGSTPDMAETFKALALQVMTCCHEEGYRQGMMEKK